MLRRIPNKLGGVIALVLSILILIIKPIQRSNKFSTKFNPIKKILAIIFFTSFIILT
ncbi:hypothetical protein JQN64_24530 [Escherichia coli]|nr:hypothetical protein [Escherichia coli]